MAGYQSDASDENDWKDVESDHIVASFVSFGGKAKFRRLEEFLADAKEYHGVDMLKMGKDLDTFGMIKLINYVRAQVNQGLHRPDLSRENFLQGDEYLKPVMEDDALLYSIDDIFDLSGQEKEVKTLADRLAEASMTLEEAQEVIRENQRMRDQLVYYRSALQRTFLEKMELQERSSNPRSDRSMDNDANVAPAAETVNDDSHYFSSYAYHDVHELMLQDKVRTDSYRDFIYENKQLFAGKVVLDVGCGTGILSLFCAKAGAAKVIAVDNSAIIDKAREIVFENGLSDTIQCLRGKIEEVSLPVKQVDIIVSEWMGYCLLYEAMLDSVIWARDQYLAPEGLMIPSHATLRLSLFADEEYISDKITFWNSVYGFQMSPMLAKAYDDIIIRTVNPDAVPSQSEAFARLQLHAVEKSDLIIHDAQFKLAAKQDVDQLHGFLIHFDIFFTTNRKADVSEAHTSFTTGPLGPETHWQQALALIDTSKNNTNDLMAGDQICGSIAFNKGADNFRELQIKINWQVERALSEDNQRLSVTKPSEQAWCMR